MKEWNVKMVGPDGNVMYEASALSAAVMDGNLTLTIDTDGELGTLTLPKVLATIEPNRHVFVGANNVVIEMVAREPQK